MPKLEETIKARVPRKLKSRLEKIAAARCKSESEVTREAVLNYVETAEKAAQAL